jgi:NitT/TauT family transport system ATP-binding protein
LEIRGSKKGQRREVAEQKLDLVHLSGWGERYPDELSGGMQQRVGLARALASDPDILLMDEPFSALDEMTKNQLQDELLRIWQRERKTILFVTHNISEAVYLADRIVVMSAHPGRIKHILDVALPRERGPEIRDTLEFIEQVRAARMALQG